MQRLGQQLKVYHEPWDPNGGPEPLRWRDGRVRYLRAKLLYNVYPYDQSIFQTMYNPWWVFFFVLSVWPLFGLQPMYYILLFCAIDRSDEYQLVSFILEFKALSSLSVGFLLTAIGAAEDHLCLTWASEIFCDRFGPGSSPTFLWETFCFAVQTFNVWVAFAYLCADRRASPA